MATLSSMPDVVIDSASLAPFGAKWKENGGKLSRSPPFSSLELCQVFDKAVAEALAGLLGGISVRSPKSSNALVPAEPDCVELGHIRIIGGVRPQNFDVGYRPDGVRFAFDSKTLNDTESIGKNWQNMVNDISTEATTVHTRFPHAVVAFLVAVPAPCVEASQCKAMIETLERLARRTDVNDPAHMAESIALVVWNPDDGTLSSTIPPMMSPLRIESFSKHVESAYVERYKGLPPHASD